VIFSFGTLQTQAQTTPSIVINEVQIAGDKADDEFIELYNTTDQPIDLNGWKLRKKTKGDTSATGSSVIDLSMANTLSLTLPAKGYLLWANSKGIFKSLTLDQLSNGNSFTNDTFDPYSIALFDSATILIDAVTWGIGHASPFVPSIPYPTNPAKNTSLERDLATNTFILQSHPTPQNTALIIEKPTLPPANTSAHSNQSIPTSLSTNVAALRINEILPHPSDTDEFIELFNFGETDIDLKGWSLRDASKTGSYVFKDTTIIKAQSYLTLFRPTFSFALNDGSETVTLFDPQGQSIHTIGYAKSNKDVSYNFSPSGWRWSDIITPNAPNQFNVPPSSKTILPKKIYIDTPALFEAKDDDANAEIKYTWNFGDGHKSRLASATHTYDKTGSYTVTLTTSTTIEDIVETFTVKVTKLPKINIAITGINPNPTGIDTGNEWITLKNLSKKKVDLLNWSIATGTTKKTLANHPIKESLILKPGKEVTLQNDISAFSLPNKDGYIELRQPNKKTVDTLHYTKTEGIEEGDQYKKSADNIWEWTNTDSTLTDNAQTQTTAPSVQDITNTNDLINMIDTLSTDELSLLKIQIENKLQLAALETTALPIKDTEIATPAVDAPTIVQEDTTLEDATLYHKQSLQNNPQEHIIAQLNQGINSQKVPVYAVENTSLLAKDPLVIQTAINSKTNLLRYLNQTIHSFLKEF